MILRQHTQGVRIAEVGNHHPELFKTVSDGVTRALQLDQLLHHGHRPLRILGPIKAVFKPVGVFRRVVILLDGLVKDFHMLLPREMGYLANAIEIVFHDDVFEPDVERLTRFLANPQQGGEAGCGGIKEVLAAANEIVRFTQPVTGHRHAPRSRSSQLFHA